MHSYLLNRLLSTIRPRLAANVAGRFIPPVVLNSLAQRALNRLFSRALAAGELDFIENRVVTIHVDDAALHLSFSVHRQQLYTCRKSKRADVTLKANFDALVDIITNQRDPDTLFFQRQLTITGDTELGLALKNFLDTCDPQTLLPKPLYRLLQNYAENRE